MNGCSHNQKQIGLPFHFITWHYSPAILCNCDWHLLVTQYACMQEHVLLFPSNVELHATYWVSSANQPSTFVLIPFLPISLWIYWISYYRDITKGSGINATTHSHTHTHTHTHSHTHTHTTTTTTTHTSRFHLTLGRSRGSGWESSAVWRDGMSNKRNTSRLADTKSIVGIELSITPLPPLDSVELNILKVYALCFPDVPRWPPGKLMWKTKWATFKKTKSLKAFNGVALGTLL